MQVFKFGGASVNSAKAVKNMASIVKRYGEKPLVVVVSAMGKTTNQLEKLVPGIPLDESERQLGLDKLSRYHQEIVQELFPDQQSPIYKKLKDLLTLLDRQTRQTPTAYNYDYDQTVSFGELISTTIVAEYLNDSGLNTMWVDVRDIIRTDTNYREGHVDWAYTQLKVENDLKPLLRDHLVVTQGFIAGTNSETTTTLGREGSDYSAAILSYCLEAGSMTIWKDVPGFLNADPKFFHDTVKINRIPYNEAIELAYYGASVIHPKTVQPIQNKNIELHIKSFITPQESGSVIGPYNTIDPQTPLYIFKNDQVLISILPKDFSFIAEDNLQTIFSALAQLGIRVNLMQNSALSFSLCIDHNEVLLRQLKDLLDGNFHLRYNEGLQLITIRYYTQQIIDSIVGGRSILLQQRSRTTTQLIVDE
jgi:aspartate kinase